MPDYAEWVSTVALLLSGGGLAWQVARARRDQPIISVDGQWSVTRSEHESWGEGSWRLPVHVTNAGGQAVTVVAVYWEVEVRAGPLRVTNTEMGTALPTRLESLSADAWEALIPVRGTLWSGLAARPAADVVLGKGVVTVYGPPATLRVPDAEPG